MKLTDYIPERKIDTGDGRRSHDSATVPEMLPPHHLPQMLDASGIFANQQLRHVLDRTDDASSMPFQRRFAPAKQARLVRKNFYKDPIAHTGMTNKRFDCSDLHFVLVRINLGTIESLLVI
jgi:hypothetical protein